MMIVSGKLDEISMVFFSSKDLDMWSHAQVVDKVIFKALLQILCWKKIHFHLSHEKRGGLDVNLEKKNGLIENISCFSNSNGTGYIQLQLIVEPHIVVDAVSLTWNMYTR